MEREWKGEISKWIFTEHQRSDVVAQWYDP